MKQIIRILRKFRGKMRLRSLFVCVFTAVCFYHSFVVAAHDCEQEPDTFENGINCTHAAATTTKSGGGLWHNKELYEINHTVLTHWAYYDPSGTDSCDGNQWCHIAPSGNINSSLQRTCSNRCGYDNGCYHLERRPNCHWGECHTSQDDAHGLVGDSRACKTGFWFGPGIFEGDTLKNNFKSNASYVYSKYGHDFTYSEITGTAYYDNPSRGIDSDCYGRWKTYGQADGGAHHGTNADCRFEFSGWDYHPYGHCHSGKLVWHAKDSAYGTAEYGFYVKFDINDIKYTCNGQQNCDAGYALGDNQMCEQCFAGRGTGVNGCNCNHGYRAEDGDYSRCVPCAENFEQVAGVSNKCLCKKGFKLVGDYSCTPCKKNYRYDSATNTCECDSQYFVEQIPQGGNQEGAECVLKTGDAVGTRYMDRAGEFYLSNDYFHNDSQAGCRFDSSDSSSYPYMINEQPSDQCSLHDSQDSSSNHCYMNNWWIGLNWSSQQ